MNNKEIKAKILQDIAAARQSGYTLVTEDWGSVATKSACALGCVALASGLPPDGGSMTETFDVSSDWISSFTDGFDDNGSAADATVPAAWRIGEEVRKETKPLQFGEFVDSMDAEDEN